MLEASALVRSHATPEARRAAVREISGLTASDLTAWPQWRSYALFALHQATFAAALAPDSVRHAIIEAIQALLRAAKETDDVVPRRAATGAVRRYWMEGEQ